MTQANALTDGKTPKHRSKSILSDDQLFRLCKKYGENARYWRQKFAGLLPEVMKRRLYEKKGFTSIFEFAAKLAGMSNERVRIVLNLSRKYEELPALRALLVNGDVSANKLVRVASIAKAENQEALAQNVRILSSRALETLVRDEKAALAAEKTNIGAEWDPIGAEANLFSNTQAGTNLNLTAHTGNEDQNGSQKAQSEHKSLHVHSKVTDIGTIVKIMEKLSPQTQNRLLELISKNININEIIETALNNRETQLAREKEENSKELKTTDSRYIPAATSRIINAEQGDKCSVPNCKKPAQATHHKIPFSMAKTHDPYNLQKLCKAHHELAHSINIKYYAMKTRALDSS